jgi:hypothetical protein
MLSRARRRVLLALVPLAVLPLLVAATHGSKRHTTAIFCGVTIFSSATLSADLGPCNSGEGVIVGADHVTLNLNGHTISSTAGSNDGVFSSHAGVVVENGAVKGFESDVNLSGDSNRVTNLRTGAAQTFGIEVTGQNDVVSGNRSFANGFVGINGQGVGSQYTNNVLQSNANVGLVVADASAISGNKALSNGSSGILFTNSANGSVTVTNNVADGNHTDGIFHKNLGGDPTVVTLTGNKAYFNGQLGINALAGVNDAGNNKADENGTAAQCTNVVCS